MSERIKYFFPFSLKSNTLNERTTPLMTSTIALLVSVLVWFVSHFDL